MKLEYRAFLNSRKAELWGFCLFLPWFVRLVRQLVRPRVRPQTRASAPRRQHSANPLTCAREGFQFFLSSHADARVYAYTCRTCRTWRTGAGLRPHGYPHGAARGALARLRARVSSINTFQGNR